MTTAHVWIRITPKFGGPLPSFLPRISIRQLHEAPHYMPHFWWDSLHDISQKNEHFEICIGRSPRLLDGVHFSMMQVKHEQSIRRFGLRGPQWGGISEFLNLIPIRKCGDDPDSKKIWIGTKGFYCYCKFEENTLSSYDLRRYRSLLFDEKRNWSRSWEFPKL